MTNFERIQKMTIDELAEFIVEMIDSNEGDVAGALHFDVCKICKYHNIDAIYGCDNIECPFDDHKHVLLWLNKEAEK